MVPKIISVYSFRHGTGKSNLTANLAVLLAQQGQRVGVIDTDLHAPGIHMLFGLDDSQLDHVLNYYLWGDVPIQSVTHDLSPLLQIDQGAIAVMGGGIYLTPSSIKIAEISRMICEGYDLSLLSQGIETLIDRLELDYLLIDMHPGLSEANLLLIALSDSVLLLLGADSQDFQSAAATIDIVNRLHIPQTLLVANQIPAFLDQSAFQLQLEATYGKPVIGVLPWSEEMMQLGSRGVFCLHHPNHELTQAMRSIAEHIAHSPSAHGAALADWLEPSGDRAAALSPGLRMMDMLALPVAQRRFLRWLIRRGTATSMECHTYLQSESLIDESVLGILIEQRLLRVVEIKGEQYYQPCLLSNPRRLASHKLWKMLDKPDG